MKPIDDIAKNSSGGVKPGQIDPFKKQKLQKAAKEFESMFVAYMLKTMRKSIPDSDLLGDKFGGDMMEGMFDLELSKHIAKKGSLGIARTLYRKLTGEELDALPASPPAVHQHMKNRAIPAHPNVEVKKSVEQVKSDIPIPEFPAGAIKQEKYVEKVKSASPIQESSVPVMKQEVLRPPKPAPVQTAPAKKSVLFQPSKSMTDRLSEFQSMIDTAAQQHGVDSTLVKAVIASESAGKPNLSSSKNAKGLMQLIDSTAADMGVQNVWDPQENIQGGVKYLKQMLERFDGDVRLAVASYNAGPGAVEKHGGIPPYKETREYVNKVLKYMQFFQQQELTAHDQ